MVARRAFSIIVNNGKLQFTVVPTRGMGVLEVKLGDVRLGWNSPVKEVVHPRHINLQSRGGLGWLEGFNEWMVRCGLESNGHPGTDAVLVGRIRADSSRPGALTLWTVTDSIRKGAATNVIPDSCELQGTVRTFTLEVLDLIEQRMLEMAKATAAATGCRGKRWWMSTRNPTATPI